MRSGDIMVMSGSSRLLYHAVPCILPAPATHPLPSCLDRHPGDDVIRNVCEDDWDVCATYLKTSRINMTVRQVLGTGQAFPSTRSHALGVTEQSGHDYDEEVQVTKKRKSEETGYHLDS